MINFVQTDKVSAATATETAVLLLAPTGRDAALSAEMLQRADLTCIVCADADHLLTLMRQGAGTAVIVAESLEPDEAVALESLLAQQPAWSDPPLIVVAGGASLPKHLTALLDRASTTVLHRPLKVATFTTTVRAAQQSRLRQFEGRDLLRALENRAAQLQKMALELVETEERERQRLAQFLHDDLQQVLAGAKLHVAMLPKRARQHQLDAATMGLSALLDEALEKSRNLSHQLSPPVLQQHGLPASLQWLTLKMGRLHALHVDADLDFAANPDDDRVRTFLFRGAQELLFNVVKHAGVKRARLILTLEGRSVAIRVIDKGRGIDPISLRQPTAGLGLVSIRERASLLGGRVEVANEDDGGCRITLVVPLEPAVPPSLARQRREDTSHVSIAQATPGQTEVARPRLRIVLADDHRVMRSGLRSLLEMEPDIEVVGEADDGLQAIELADHLQPDLVLMDLSMPRMDGIEATRCIKARHPAIHIIGLSMSDDEQSALKMQKAGADAYLPKAGAAGKLLAAVRDSCRAVAR